MDPNKPETIRIAIITEGSRGDMQPYIALALQLRKRGNSVAIFTHTDQMDFIRSFDIDARGVFYDSSVAFQHSDFLEAMASGNSLKVAKFLRYIRMSNMEDDLRKLFRGLDDFRPTTLLVGCLSRGKGLLYSLVNNIPLLPVDLQVLLPVSDKGFVGLPTLPFGTNNLWWKLLEPGMKTMVQHIKIIARKSLDIDPNRKFEFPAMEILLRNIPDFPAPVCYGISSHVIPVHPEWPTENFYPCGFFTIGPEEQERLMHQQDHNKGNGSSSLAPKRRGSHFGAGTDAVALTKFLSEGPAPVYLGWGSMVCRSPELMVSLAVAALQHANCRGILLGGWAGLAEEHVPADLAEFSRRNVLFVRTAPHEWLFPRCACIVHHGGSGTTAASVRSGKPTIITPIQGDQFDFADGINTIGCGVGLPHLGKVTPALMGDTILRCLGDEDLRARADATGTKLREEDGCEKFCRVFDEWLVNGYASGEWLRKHEALLRRCEESWKVDQQPLRAYSTTAILGIYHFLMGLWHTLRCVLFHSFPMLQSQKTK